MLIAISKKYTNYAKYFGRLGLSSILITTNNKNSINSNL